MAECATARRADEGTHNYQPVIITGQILMVGGERILTGDQIEIPYGRSSIIGRVVYDDIRCYFKLVTQGAYWVVLRSGFVARLLREYTLSQ
jgi:hypothetical protein